MLQVNNISYTYGDTDSGFRNISFELQQGEHLAIMGESGCGKSTLLKAIYGLFDLQQGEISFHQDRVLGPAYQLVPGHSKMKFLSQDFGLMPFHTIGENVGKFLSNINLEQKKNRILELLSLVEMEKHIHRKPVTLSGGEKQRVALAVTLAKQPDLLLLDEPFSQIDHFRKNQLQRTIFSYLKSENIGCIVATHDGKDALAYADKTLIIKQGKNISFGATLDIYHQNTDFYIASLFGEVSQHHQNGKEILLKPHQIEIVDFSDWEVSVHKNYFQGDRFLIEGMSANQKVYFFSQKELKIGEKVFLSKKN